MRNSKSLLTSRAVWEETVWTWEFGPRLLGFFTRAWPRWDSFLISDVLVAWIAVAVALIARNWIRRRRVTQGTWIALPVAILPLVIQSLGEDFWQRVFINRMAASPRIFDTVGGKACSESVKARGFLQVARFTCNSPKGRFPCIDANRQFRQSSATRTGNREDSTRNEI
jgi:hypothetical protein